MNKKKTKKMQWDKMIGAIFALTFFALMLGIVLTQTFAASERPQSQLSGKRHQGDWFIYKGGEKSSYALNVPFKAKSDGTGSILLGTNISEEMAMDGAIGIVSNRYCMEFFVDDVKRGEYDTTDTRVMGQYSPVYLNLIRLYPEDAGKTFYVKVMDNGSGLYNIDNVYTGTELGIWYYIISERPIEIGASFFLFIVSGSCVICGLIIRIAHKKGGTLVYIASSVFLISLWSITQSAYRPLIFRNVSIIADMPFIALTLVPVTMLLFFNSVQDARYQRLELPFAFFGLFNLWVQIALHKLEIMDYSKSVYVTFLYLISCIVVMDVTMIKDVITGQYKSYLMVGSGIVVVQITGVIQIISYIVKYSDHSSGFINVGIIFLFIMAVVKTIQDTLQNDRKRLEAENASRMKEEFLAGMSHEIRTPLNAVLGLNDMIIDTTKEKQTMEYAMDVRSAGKSLLAIINDVLDFSKINTGQIDLTETEYEVTSLINDCYNVVNKRAADKKLEFKIMNDETMPSRLIGDEDRVRQIIINLLNNAIKYTEKGNVYFQIGWGKPENEDAEGLLKITVRDTGIGIRGEDRERIYESFTRLDKLKNRKVEGTGLGLAITKRLVDAMGGTISFQSDYGIGTTFLVEIPQKVADFEPAGKYQYHSTAREVAEKLIDFDASGIKALVVDDNELNLKVAGQMLLSVGMEVETARNGDECINKARNNHYDIIFLDHMMPGKDGIETLREMRDAEKDYLGDTPVVMLTANVVAGAKEEYGGLGFSDYLAKPFKKQELLRVVMENVSTGR